MARYNGFCKTCGAPVAGHAEFCPDCGRERQRQLQREHHARERAARPPLKPCQDCGRLLVPNGTRRMLCDECRNKHKKETAGQRVSGTINEARRAAGLAAYHGKPARGKRVEDILHVAALEGLSYGQYVQRHGL